MYPASGSRETLEGLFEGLFERLFEGLFEGLFDGSSHHFDPAVADSGDQILGQMGRAF